MLQRRWCFLIYPSTWIDLQTPVHLESTRGCEWWGRCAKRQSTTARHLPLASVWVGGQHSTFCRDSMEPATFSRPSPIAEPSSPEAGPPVPHILPSNQPNPSSKNQIRKRAKQAKYDALRVLRPAKRREEKKIRREKRQCLSDQGDNDSIR